MILLSWNFDLEMGGKKGLDWVKRKENFNEVYGDV